MPRTPRSSSSQSRWLRRTPLASLALSGALLIGLTSASGAQAGVTPTGDDQRLASASVTAAAEFGASVDMTGDTLVIGVPTSDRAEFGAAYVYTRDAAGAWANPQMLVAGDTRGGDLFGTSVAIDGDTIVIGASGDRAFGFGSGSAYVFTSSGGTWTQQAKINAADTRSGDSFGSSVAISGDTVVIGAIGNDTVTPGILIDPVTGMEVLDPITGEPVPGLLVDDADVGSAYVFTRTGSTWTEQEEILADDFAASDQFGSAVAVDGDTLVVGVRQDDTAIGADAGSAYVFTRTNGDWTQQQQLFASDPARFDFFGESVAIDGNTIVIGVPGEDPQGFTNAGAISVFSSDGAGSWSRSQADISAPVLAVNDHFGTSVDIDGPNVIVGAPADVLGATEPGAAYVFAPDANGALALDQHLIPAGATLTDEFGAAVAIAGDTKLVGAPGADAAHVFTDGPAPAPTPDPDPTPDPVNPAPLFCNGLEVTVNLAAGDVPTAGADVILGTDGPDVINARGGHDVICAGGGDDTILGGDGADTIFGGAGNDTIEAGQGLDTVYGQSGDDSIAGGKGKDVLNGGGGDDVIRGNEGTDTLNGGAGDDELRGGQKADVINGGSGNDILVGGIRGDVLDGGTGQDIYSGGAGPDTCRVDPAGLTETATSCERR